MRVYLLAACIGLAALSATAGAKSAQPVIPRDAISASTARNPSVLAYEGGVRSEATERSLDIRRMDLRVNVRGAVAVSEMNLWVHAASAETVEGHVRIALPAGTVVTGYALDVDGAMVEGSLVEAARAEAAYERQVRGQVDPGLAKIDAGGAFTTRVFPIDRGKGRRLRLRFVTPVANGYRLPLDLAWPVDGWAVVVSGDGAQARLGGRGLQQRGRDAVLTGTRAIRGDLVIDPPQGPEALASLHSTGETYWQLSGPMPKAQRRTGGTMRIYWDRSRSRRDQDHAAELRQVRDAARALAPERIEWVAFSSGAPERTTLANAAEIDRRVGALRYAGATSYAVLASDPPADTCVLVSDGQATLDEGRLAPLPCRLFAIAPAEGSNVARLTSLAQASGGQFVAADRGAVDWHAPAIEQVLDASGTPLRFVTLGSSPDRWTVAVKAPPSGPVRVMIGGAAVQREPVAAPLRFDGEGAILARAQLAALEGTADRPAFVELSRRYSIASPTLSFVVLERPEDYVRNGIEPPRGYKRHSEWAELKLAEDANRKAAEQNRFAQLLKDWNEQVAWYETRFDLTARPPQRNGKGQPAPSVIAAPAPAIAQTPGTPTCPDGSSRGAAASCPAPPPPPPPPPPAPAPAPAYERDDEYEPEGAQEVVVTANRTPAESPGSNSRDLLVSVAAWRPERDYLDAYDKAPGAFDHIYPDWEKKAGGVPSFYLDTADWLYRQQRLAPAEQVLMSALDLPTANQITLGMVAARLERYGLIDMAVGLRERQALLDPDRPQPKRLLALALARRAALGRAGAKADLERAISLLLEIALKPVDGRWKGIDLISMVEANNLLVRLRRLGGDVAVDPRLIRNMASDVRIVIDWSSDATDVDLWVDEPNGERAIYSNPRTRIGGHLSNDMTEGFGPEEYLLRRAATGAYVTRADVYAPDRLDPNGAARVTAHLYRDWGRPTERVESIDFDVRDGEDEEVRIGTLTVERSGEGDEARVRGASSIGAPAVQRRAEPRQ